MNFKIGLIACGFIIHRDCVHVFKLYFFQKHWTSTLDWMKPERGLQTILCPSVHPSGTCNMLKAADYILTKLHGMKAFEKLHSIGTKYLYCPRMGLYHLWGTFIDALFLACHLKQKLTITIKRYRKLTLTEHLYHLFLLLHKSSVLQDMGEAVPPFPQSSLSSSH